MTALQDLFLQAGYPAFPLDEQGFPQIGPVIKYFRKQMVYTDLDGSERWWRQQDLADALGLKEDMIGLMETKNVTEDSISRRRALAEALNIPPVFLGLGTLADLEAFLQACGTAQPHGKSTANENEVSLYQDALELHWGMHYAGTLQDISTIQRWSHRIELAANEHSASQQSLEELICEYYRLLARVHADKHTFSDAFQYLDNAQVIASRQGSKSLEAAIFYEQVMVRLDQGVELPKHQRKFALAKAPTDAAVSLVRHADKSLQGEIYQAASITYALTAQDKKDRKKAREFLDLAGNIADEGNLGIDVHHVRFNSGRHALWRADTLITLGELEEAVSQLDDAEEYLPSDEKRRRGYIDILRGEAYIKKKKIDAAISYLQSAFDTSSVIHSDYNIGYIARLCQELSNSRHGNSPAVAKLKRLLREYREKQAKEQGQPSRS